MVMSLQVRVWQLHVLRLKIKNIHLSYKTPNKCLNVCEKMEMVQRNKYCPFSSPTVL